MHRVRDQKPFQVSLTISACIAADVVYLQIYIQIDYAFTQQREGNKVNSQKFRLFKNYPYISRKIDRSRYTEREGVEFK